MRYTVCKVIFCLILYAVCLELHVLKKHSGTTFEHVPPIGACHRVEGQGTECLEPVQKLWRSIPGTACALLEQPDLGCP